MDKTNKAKPKRLQRLKVGTRVRAIANHDGKNIKGLSGVIVVDWGHCYGVRWSKRLPGFHDCGTHCPNGYGWNVDRDIIVVDKNFIEKWEHKQGKRKMTQFKVGMRIKAIGDFNGNRLKGLCGTIMHIHDGTNLLCVAWEQKIQDGHDCNGRCEQGYGCDIE